MFLWKGTFQFVVCTVLYSADLFLLHCEHLPVIVLTSRCQHQTTSAKHKPSAANAAPSQSSSKSLSPGAPPCGRGGGAEVTMGGGKLSSSVAVYEGSSKRHKASLVTRDTPDTCNVTTQHNTTRGDTDVSLGCKTSISVLHNKTIFFNYNFAEWIDRIWNCITRICTSLLCAGHPMENGSICLLKMCK